MWQGEERTRREAKAVEKGRARRVVVHSKQEVARGPSFGGGQRGFSAGGERNREAGRRWKKRTSLQFEKF